MISMMKCLYQELLHIIEISNLVTIYQFLKMHDNAFLLQKTSKPSPITLSVKKNYPLLIMMVMLLFLKNT